MSPRPKKPYKARLTCKRCGRKRAWRKDPLVDGVRLCRGCRDGTKAPAWCFKCLARHFREPCKTVNS